MKTLSLAIRNVTRRRSRALVTTGAMAFAVFIMLIYASLMDGIIYTFERNVVSLELGEIQIHAIGYRDDPDLYKRIENPDKLIKALSEAGFKSTPRLSGFGLAAYGPASSGVQLRGVDQSREKNVTKIHRHMMSGYWLDDSDSKGVVLGKKLARTLNVNVGGEIVFLGQAADGSMANDLFLVRGILKSVGDGLDRAGLFMLEKDFRELMAMPEGVHEIAIMREKRDLEPGRSVELVFGLAPGLEVKSWRELRPVVAKMLDTSHASFLIMLFITYTAVGMVILNAMLMSVFERIRELGVMKAVGMSPVSVLVLIFTEAMIQALAACALGLAAGLPVACYFQANGLDLSTIYSGGSFGGVAIDPVWHARVTVSSLLLTPAFLVVAAFLAVIYPGVKAAMIRPIHAINYR